MGKSTMHIHWTRLAAVPFDGETHCTACEVPYCCEWATFDLVDRNPYYEDQIRPRCDQHVGGVPRFDSYAAVVHDYFGGESEPEAPPHAE